MIHFGAAGVFGSPRQETKPAHSFSQSAYCTRWGSAKGARRVHGLTREERESIRAGAVVMLQGCPAVRGVTVRKIVAIGRGFYARMP